MKIIPYFKIDLLIKTKFVFYVFLLATTKSITAQNNVIYNQFFMNPYMYNPAYAGVEGHTVVFGFHKQQWQNIKNAPTYSNVNFHTPLKNGLGFGAMVFNQSIGPINNTWGKVSGSYLITIDKEHHFRFGMSAGGGVNSIDFTELDAPDDPALLNLVDNNFMIGDFGATYHFDHFNIGFSIPNLVTYDAFVGESRSSIKIRPLDNLMIKTNYRGHITDDFALESHLIYRYSRIGPSLLEGTAIAHIYHVVWAGITYRQDNNVIGLAGFKVNEKIAIGYTFELGNPNFAGNLGPSHEIHFGYHIGDRKHSSRHVSSFIKSHRLTPEEREMKAEREREEKLAALMEPVATTENKEPNNDTDNINKDEKKTDQSESQKYLTEDINNTDQEDTSIKKYDNTKTDLPIDQSKKIEDNTMETTLNDENPSISDEQNQALEADQKVLDSIPVADEPQQDEEIGRINPDLTDDFRSYEELSRSDKPMKVKRGNHLLELPPGNYVIAGVFESFEYAESYSDKLFEMGYYKSIIGFVSARSYYYTIIYKNEDFGKAKAEWRRLKILPNLSSIWLLTVEE